MRANGSESRQGVQAEIQAILYARIPGLIAHVARTQLKASDTVPVIVSVGRDVRDTCALGLGHGIGQGQLLTHARRRCPWLLSIPLEEIDKRSIEALTRRLLLDPLADITPVIEPAGEDSAWADLHGCPEPLIESIPERLSRIALEEIGATPIIGMGPSRLAARAVAECQLPPGNLSLADATHWLWPEDPAVGARLGRLGLSTFGEVAEAGEGAIVHVFGAKLGRLLHRRAATGQDFASPIRALYPSPVVSRLRRFSEEPLANREALDHVVGEMRESVGADLRKTGLFARRVSLSIRCEDDPREHRTAWTVPAPVQTGRDLSAVLPVLLRRLLPAIHTAITEIEITADDLTLPPAATGDLFTVTRARHKDSIAATRRMLVERHGPRILRRLGELPVELRDTRRSLVREGQYVP